MPDRSLLSWEHYRGDSELALSEVVTSDESCAFAFPYPFGLGNADNTGRRIVLTSRRNDLKTVYTLAGTSAPRSILSPYSLAQINSKERVGTVGLASVHLADGRPSLFVEVDSNGALRHSVYALNEDVSMSLEARDGIMVEETASKEEKKEVRGKVVPMRAVYKGAGMSLLAMACSRPFRAQACSTPRSGQRTISLFCRSSKSMGWQLAFQVLNTAQPPSNSSPQPTRSLTPSRRNGR